MISKVTEPKKAAPKGRPCIRIATVIIAGSKLEDIASSVRVEYDTDEENLKAMCLEASRRLVAKLSESGIVAKVVQGCFEIDNPDEEAYADWDTADFNDDEEEMEAAKRFPLHYWVEAKHAGRVWIVDITADQFNDECDEEFEPVIVTTYRDQPRYRKQKSPWRSL